MQYQLNIKTTNNLSLIILSMVKQPKPFIVMNDWMDKKLDAACVSDSVRNLLYSHWVANGYVAVTREYRCYWMDYMKLSWPEIVDDNPDIDYDPIDVHGWLTFGEHLSKVGPLIKNAYLQLEWTSEDDDVWIFGFDTNHYGDNQVTQNKAYVEKEAENLASQMLQFCNE